MRCRKKLYDALSVRSYERLPESSEAMVQVSMIHLMLRRLRPGKRSRPQRFCYPRL